MPLEATEDLVEAVREFVRTRNDYWSASTALEGYVGRDLEDCPDVDPFIDPEGVNEEFVKAWLDDSRFDEEQPE